MVNPWVRFRYIVGGDSVLNSGVADPDPARRIHMFWASWIRIRIHTKMSWIRNTA
jgi:hypothetical protein